jgi:serine/threonine-protein kinase RsbW
MQPAASDTLALRTSEITYPGAAEHIRRVRDDLRPLLTGCPQADEIILCASELAANAALHSNSRLPGGTFTVRAQINPGHHVRIEVEDNGGPWTPATANSTGHHGLDIVRTLATDWGTSGDHTTRITWARFSWPDHP